MLHPLLTKTAIALSALLLIGAGSPAPIARYTEDGKLVVPDQYRRWVFLTSSLDMNYQPGPPMADGHMLDNVFVDPAAWGAFQATGHWPDQTIMVKEDRLATSQGSINRNGFYQTEEIMGLEFHVHDEARFPGGWAFFVTTGDGPAEPVPQTLDCYACHQAHGAVDTTFTQFYPTAKIIAAERGTLRPEPDQPQRSNVPAQE